MWAVWLNGIVAEVLMCHIIHHCWFITEYVINCHVLWSAIRLKQMVLQKFNYNEDSIRFHNNVPINVESYFYFNF